MGALLKLKKARNGQRGFGLMEVVASMFILGLLFTALMYLQYHNRLAAIRIQARNEATRIAQNYIDSLSAQGLHQVKPIVNRTVQGSVRNLQTGVSVRQTYKVNVAVTEIQDGNLVKVGDSTYQNIHVNAKRLDVDVEYQLNQIPYHVRLSAVVE